MSQRVHIPAFAGGIDNSQSALDIADNSLSVAINFELSRRALLVTRDGCGLVKSGGGPFTADAPTTSIFDFKTSSGAETILYTSETEAYRRVPSLPETATAFTNLSAALTFPDGERWRWAQFDDVAIGVNGGSRVGGVDNPVVLLTPASANCIDTTADSWSGSFTDAPQGIIVWNRRVWLYEGNEIHACAAGDHRDHSTTGGAGEYDNTVGADEGDVITSWVEWQDRLFIFKENRIYELVAGSPNVDTNQYEVRSVTSSLGCIQQETIQTILGDVLFLSHHGVVSLTKLLTDGADPIISRAITELQNVNTDGTLLASHIVTDKSQYWISIPTESTAASTNKSTWVADMRFPTEEGVPPWLRWNGAPTGTSYANAFVGSKNYPIIGGYGEAYLMDSARADDNSATGYEPDPRSFITKSFDVGEFQLRKDFYRIGLQLIAGVTSISYDLVAELDLNTAKRKSFSGTFTLSTPGSTLGPPDINNELWDAGFTVGEFILGSDLPEIEDAVFSLRHGRRGKSISLKVTTLNDLHSYTVRGAFFDYDMIQQLEDFNG